MRELQTLIDLSGVKRVNSIFFGGGTPSLASPETIDAVIGAVKERVAMPTDVEISMEANPTSVEMKKLQQFKCAGINRLSLGIQALNNSDLKILGRDHTVDQSLSCIHEARKLFPGRLSIDIIFGRPSQTLESWVRELEEILDVCDDHVSLYQLTLEPGTLLYKLNKQGILTMPGADVIADMYEVAVRRLAQASFHRYEISNFARSLSAESKHNKAYWEGKQYIGVGPGAHGRFCPITEQHKNSNVNKESTQPTLHSSEQCTRERKSSFEAVKPDCSMRSQEAKSEENQKSGETSTSIHFQPQRDARIQTPEPQKWMQEVETFGHATRKHTLQSSPDILRELLLTGLRVPQGVLDRTWMQFGADVSLGDLFGPSQFVSEATDAGWMELDSRGLRCTEKGLNLLDSFMPNLIEILDSYYDGERES